MRSIYHEVRIPFFEMLIQRVTVYFFEAPWIFEVRRRTSPSRWLSGEPVRAPGLSRRVKILGGEAIELERFRFRPKFLARSTSKPTRKSDAIYHGEEGGREREPVSWPVPQTSSSHELVDSSLPPLGPFHLRATSTVLREFNYPHRWQRLGEGNAR